VTVHGASVGLVTYTGRAREGHTGCEATQWESETSVRCLVAHGARGTRRVTMTVGEREGTITQALSADLIALSMMRRKGRAGTGSASVMVHGASEHGACDVHGTGSGGAHGSRGDAVEVRDIADLKANGKENLKNHCPALFIHIYTN
jgi:hypothetical protein